MIDEYASSIPESATEIVTEWYPDGQKQRADYVLDGEIVGVRWFHETGEPEGEQPLKNGRRHGVQYR